MSDGDGAAAGKGRRERGSSLLLWPVGVLIVLGLAAVTVDAGVAFLAEREVSGAAAAAANDAAGALDEAAFQTTGDVRIDPARAESLARRAVAVRGADWLDDVAVEVAVGPRQVTVSVRARVDTIFARAVPGGPDRFDVGAEATAVPRRR